MNLEKIIQEVIENSQIEDMISRQLKMSLGYIPQFFINGDQIQIILKELSKADMANIVKILPNDAKMAATKNSIYIVFSITG